MVLALHEMVHWVSHPPEQGHRLTAWLALDEGLIEGLTQVVTEDIFEDRGISQYWKAIYMEQVAIVRKLIERFGVQPFGEVLFPWPSSGSAASIGYLRRPRNAANQDAGEGKQFQEGDRNASTI